MKAYADDEVGQIAAGNTVTNNNITL